jgi:aminobenzoyl-glutamate utilization protein B
MAATGVDVILDADLRSRAKADLAARVGSKGYVCPLPDGAKPPVEEMSGK